MPSRILATHICTYVQSLRSGDAGAYVAGHLESGRKSRPEKAGEDSVPKSKSNDGVIGMRATHLTRTGSSTGWCSLGRGSRSR